MGKRMSVTEESVMHLFAELKARKVPAVVLRNYQDLPNVGSDLDAAIQRDDINVLRGIFRSEYFRARWSGICEVKTHNSKVDEHNIFIFKFFNNLSDEYMQIDFFQGFSLKAQPIINTDDMLRAPRSINGFPVVNPEVELKIKYFQILSALSNNQEERTRRYAEQALVLSEFCEEFSGINYKRLNHMLKAQEYNLFSQKLIGYRRSLLNKLLLQHPFMFLKNAVSRLAYYYSFLISCPFVVVCEISPKTDRKMLREILENLVEKKCFRGYYCRDNELPVSRFKKYFYLAQGGGVIIKYKDSAYYTSSMQDLHAYIIDCFMSRHNSLI